MREHLNILFVLYHDFRANSAGQIYPLANELVRLGHNCAVAVPRNKETISVLGTPLFRCLDFSQLEDLPTCFPDRRGPDVIHSWTPRENVRIFTEAALSRYPSMNLFVHLEDNEWHLLEQSTAQSIKSLSALSPEELDYVVPPDRSHPIRGVSFMKQATGITVIIDKLRELVPEGLPTLELWPSADESLFSQSSSDSVSRQTLGIPPGNTILVYPGNVHAANAREVRSLYLAVALLNREGHPTTLVRAGLDFVSFLGPDEGWARSNAIELGYIAKREIPSFLALADVFVQPGRPDHFNDYRFPSKLPDFLAMGRPVILPRSNIGLHMRHEEDAWVLDNANGPAIAEAVRAIMTDSALYARLADGALRFFRARLSWPLSARNLSSFYVQESDFARHCATSGS